MREITKLAAILTLICAVTAGALEIVKVQLLPRIEMQNDFYVRGPALDKLFGKSSKDQIKNKVILKYNDFQLPIFYTVTQGKVDNLALEAAGKGGYGGDIVIMLGIDLNTEKIIGLEIIQHAETPGVGSQIEKISFRKQWKNMSMTQSIKLKSEEGQIDGISGATYSSGAVLNGTNLIIEIFSKHKNEIIELINNNMASKN